MGTPESAVPSLLRLLADGHEIVAVWTQPDKPAGRGKKLHESPVKVFALQHKLVVYQLQKIRTPEAQKLFTSHRAEVAVVVAYGRILPAQLLSAPSHGCINVHFSLLPKYRGAAPVNWAIVNGETQSGVTTMQIVEQLDAGPILLQRETRIEPSDTAPALMSRLAAVGGELISETLRNLDRIEPAAQIDENATFAPMLKREDGLINWSMDAFAIERRVRGFQPWPNAYTVARSKRLIIWRAAPEVSESQTIPGKVIDANKDRLAIGCGDSSILRLVEVQPEGGRRLSARDIVNGNYLKPGDQLG